MASLLLVKLDTSCQRRDAARLRLNTIDVCEKVEGFKLKRRCCKFGYFHSKDMPSLLNLI